MSGGGACTCLHNAGSRVTEHRQFTTWAVVTVGFGSPWLDFAFLYCGSGSQQTRQTSSLSRATVHQPAYDGAGRRPAKTSSSHAMADPLFMGSIGAVPGPPGESIHPNPRVTPH